MPKVLLTGAAGGVATMLRPLLLARYGETVLSDRVPVQGLEPGETFRQAELFDERAVQECLAGVDRVIHLGGMSVEAPWDTILQSNIVGLHTFYEACRSAGVKRVVFASSNHVVGFYGRQDHLDDNSRVRPDTRYGVSKAFGEALSAYYADKFGMACLSIRIGNVAIRPADRRGLSVWIHPEDMMQLCQIGLEHPKIHNQIVFGISDNSRAWWDNSVAASLGYEPRHNSEDFAHEHAESDAPPAEVGDLYQGGGFCSVEYEGDPERALRS